MAGLLKQPRVMPPSPPAGQMQAGQPDMMPPDQSPPAPQADPMQSGQQAPQQEQETPNATEDDPAFQAAMKFAMQALYQQGAADNVSAIMKKAPDMVEALSNTAYEMTSVVDEKTQGAVPDELLVLLASRILEEVADIAVASGAEVTPKIVAEAFKVMILRYVGDQGYDTRNLKASMDAVPDNDFEKLLNSDVGGKSAAPQQAEQPMAQQQPTSAPMAQPMGGA